MNKPLQLVAAASALAMVTGLGLVTVAPADAAPVVFDVSNDHVTCNTLSGKIGFAVPLLNSGATTGAQTITIKGKVGGCTDTDNSAVGMFKGTLSATLNTNNGNACTGLLGPSNISGTARIVWSPAPGQKFTPTVLVGTAQKPVSDVTFSQVTGGVFTISASEAPWNASYGKFTLGAAYGMLPMGVATDFTGGDGGATSWFSGTTQQDLGDILNSCANKGLKTVSFGIGAVTLG